MQADFLSTFVAWATDQQVAPRTALSHLAGAIAVATGAAVEAEIAGGLELLSPEAHCVVPWVVPPSTSAGLLGRAHEALLGAEHRHAKGVHYTPEDVAEGVVASLFNSRDKADPTRPPTVCDPAVGGGAFLVAAANQLAATGRPRAEIVEHLLWGVDIDPLAVQVSSTVLGLWAAETDRLPESNHLVAGDTLLSGTGAWSDAPAEGFDVVVGNPPFQNQLGAATRRSQDLDALRARFGRLMYRYADTAGMFLYESCRLAAPNGRVSLIVPQSFLVSDDASALRRAILDLGAIEEIWIANEVVFDAGVRVCAPLIAIGVEAKNEDRSEVRRSLGRAFVAASSRVVDQESLRSAPSWAQLGAGLAGVPVVEVELATKSDTLGSFCEATAGFRDQFYGVKPFVRESQEGEARVAPLITCGLIEPARNTWQTRRTRFAGSGFLRPVVDLEALARENPKLMSWTCDRLTPKVIVATQTRIMEAIVDERGVLYPSVPTISLSCDPSRLWEAAAVVMAPAVSAWALGRHGGAALSSDAIKVSARQLLDVPLPKDRDSWLQACEPLRRASMAPAEAEWRGALAEFGNLMGRAYEVDAGVFDWWLARIPSWRH